LYQKAFVRWFVQQDGDMDAEARARIDRYRALLRDPKALGNN